MDKFTCENGDKLYRLILTKEERRNLAQILLLADYDILIKNGIKIKTVIKLYNEIAAQLA